MALMLVSFASTNLGLVYASTLTPIQHVIIVMQENHSFDNYFGTYPTANGTRLDSTTAKLNRVNGLPNHICVQFSNSCIGPQLSTETTQADPIEGQTVYERDYSGGGTGFANYSGPQSMTYFDYRSIAGYWDYAEEYGLGDNYYASVLSTTTPNRLMTLTGDTPVSANYGPPPQISYSTTLMQQLDNAGVSWGYYDYLNAFGGASNLYPLNYTTNIPPNALSNIRDVFRLEQELSRGSGLPSVAFVNLLGVPDFTEHPPFNPTTGELRVISIVNSVMQSSYWSSTAIFLTWDEGGGFYDHVIPPREFTIDHGFHDPLTGLGQRVPLLVISPFSKQNYVSNNLLSHLSLTHLIEYNWNLPPLNPLIGESNLPLDFFNFSQNLRSPLILVSPIDYPIPLQMQQAILLPISSVQDETIALLLIVPSIFVLSISMRRLSNRERRA